MAEVITARHVRRGSRNFEDALGCARLALVEVAARFDPTLGVKFSTYAYARVNGAVKEFITREVAAAKYHGPAHLHEALTSPERAPDVQAETRIELERLLEDLPPGAAAVVAGAAGSHRAYSDLTRKVIWDVRRRRG